MEFLGHFRRLTPLQRNTFTACFLGWSLDAFDFFILTFCVSAIASQFQTKISAVAEAIFITLAFRPVGAFLFGLMADRFGRRPTLMVDIIAYSVFELASAFAPSLKVSSSCARVSVWPWVANGAWVPRSHLKRCPQKAAVSSPDFFRKATWSVIF